MRKRCIWQDKEVQIKTSELRQKCELRQESRCVSWDKDACWDKDARVEIRCELSQRCASYDKDASWDKEPCIWGFSHGNSSQLAWFVFPLCLPHYLESRRDLLYGPISWLCGLYTLYGLNVRTFNFCYVCILYTSGEGAAHLQLEEDKKGKLFPP